MYLRWYKYNEKLEKIIVPPPCPHQCEGCHVTVSSQHIRRRCFSRDGYFRLVLQEFKCSHHPAVPAFTYVSKHAQEGRPAGVRVHPRNLVVTPSSILTEELFKDCLRDQIGGRMPTRTMITQLRERWMSGLMRRVDEALAMAEALGESAVHDLGSALHWEEMHEAIGWFGKDMMNGLFRAWWEDMGEDIANEDIQRGMEACGVRQGVDHTYRVMKGSGAFITLEGGRIVFRGGGKKSLFSVLDEFNRVILTRMMPNDTMAPVLCLMEEIWRVMKAQGRVCRVYYTGAPCLP